MSPRVIESYVVTSKLHFGNVYLLTEYRYQHGSSLGKWTSATGLPNGDKKFSPVATGSDKSAYMGYIAFFQATRTYKKLICSPTTVSTVSTQWVENFLWAMVTLKNPSVYLWDDSVKISCFRADYVTYYIGNRVFFSPKSCFWVPKNCF